MHTPLSVQIPEERMLLAGTGEETCTFVLFLENHAHYSIKYFLIDRSLPLPISFIHWLYAISIIQEEITGRFALQIVLFLIFSLSFFFLFFFSFSLLDKSLFEVMFNTVAIFRRITVWLWRPFFDSKTRRNKDQIIYMYIYVYMHRIMHLSGNVYCSMWCKLFFPRWEHNTVRLGRWPSLQWTYNSHEETDAPATRRIIGYT